MFSYVVRKLLYAVPVIWGVVTIVFILMAIVPGDPARLMMGQRGDPETLARIRADLGLDLPIHKQYVRFLKDLARGDLGVSYRNNEKVVDALMTRFGATLKLAFWAMILASILGILAGIISAVKQYSIFDYSAMFIAISGISAPVFWVGLLLLLIFAYTLHLIPGVGYVPGDWRYFILPVITLGVRPAALIARLTRSCMLEVMTQDYIRTARAKGLHERAVVMRHALKNALIPVVTIVGTEVADLLSGAVLTETIFAWPGVGRLAVEALVARDFPMIRGTVIFMAVIFLVANLIVDISYGFIDPRIRYD
ncbi:ABC-type dipeptide/oligopeptide/nickel transport system, permease component [Acetomicrobium mobile DSM 13181]|uniref:ABC-type dipeptide/oligopeptide/nickel transport system, permease component n=2 Tax=Acetomicrobium TaxID=49894 RepID=I4BZH0_ACEMN|nr:ABC transporter permease [Acetomicrobium mobile]AFM22677.1 ABC-type dipeptide/oligopeptide/nickel transport system, permease component [Acetomicrobium mobile DSM 13181]SIN68079.1 peptide/nickel transport system permease protein [Acetomicrobium flavidum]